ncbi:hypothetical protein BLKGLAD_39040 [Burkholderia gladioli pv. gladioli]
MLKVPKQVYTAEFKLAAVQRIKDGKAVTVVTVSGAFQSKRFVIE